MIKNRAIIIAAGEATRWGNYLGIPKHFVEIDGERIIDRTVRLLRENGVDDIYIVARDERYKIDGAELYIPKLTPEYHDADKFLSSAPLWLPDGKTMVLYGDCYFSELLMKTIVESTHPDWQLFARFTESRITGGAGECFAQTFYPNNIGEHLKALVTLVNWYDKGIIDRIGGWEHYNMMTGATEENIHKHIMRDRLVQVDDWSDDFDTPLEYDRYIERKSQPCFLCGK